MTPEYLAFLGVLAVLAGSFIFQTVTTGPAVTEPTVLDGDGTVRVYREDGQMVEAEPRALAAGMQTEPNAYALARVMASEATPNELVQTAVGWTVVNYARRHGRTLLKLITDVSGDEIGDGYFGQQAQGRYVASSRDTTPELRQLAVDILAGDVDDPTGGAEHFDSPRSYGAQAGTDASGADRFASNRENEGFEMVTLPGVPATTIRFWRPA